jgi:hypothetical protein
MLNWRKIATITVSALALTLVLGTSRASAQEGIGIGAKIGWLSSNLKFEGNDDEQSDVTRGNGWMGGIWFGGNRGGAVGFMGELNYGQAKVKDAHTDQVFKRNFFQITAGPRFNFGSEDRERVGGYIYVGPALDFNLKSSLTDEPDFDENIEDFTVNAFIGAGVEITRFIIELRYIRGLKSLSKDLDDINDFGFKNEAYALLFGIRFN